MGVNDTRELIAVGDIRFIETHSGLQKTLVVAGPFQDSPALREWMLVPLELSVESAAADETVVSLVPRHVAMVWAAQPVLERLIGAPVSKAPARDVDEVVDRLLAIEDGRIKTTISFEGSERRQEFLKSWVRLAGDHAPASGKAFVTLTSSERLSLYDGEPRMIEAPRFFGTSFLHRLRQRLRGHGEPTHLRYDLPAYVITIAAHGAERSQPDWTSEHVIFSQNLRIPCSAENAASTRLSVPR